MKSNALRGEGYMIDFFGPGYDAAERLGLLGALEGIHLPTPRLLFVDDAGRERLSLPYPVLRRRVFGGRHFNFMRGDLERVLFNQVFERIDVHFGTIVEALAPRGGQVEVQLSNGMSGPFDVVVGADGVHSNIRRLVFGEERSFSRWLGCQAAAFTLADAPSGIDADAFVTMTELGRQVAVYPIRDGRLATLFVYRADRPVARGAIADDAVASELRAAFGSMGWIVPDLLERVARADELTFDAVTQIEVPEWATGRIVLVGDACGCMSLLAGQGASMAMAGAYVLAEELASEPSNVEGVLASYQARVMPIVAAKQAAGRRIADYFPPASRFRLFLRDLGLRASLWPVTSAVMRHRLAPESSLVS